VFGQNGFDTGLLVFSGVLTALPLILFSYAARRVALSTVGVLQYINPTGQFLTAVLLFGESFTVWHMASFALIWAGLVLYSLSALGQGRASRRLAMAADGSGARVISPASDASAKP
jgi:chloramphenicol-sensitive protein RarD